MPLRNETVTVWPLSVVVNSPALTFLMCLRLPKVADLGMGGDASQNFCDFPPCSYDWFAIGPNTLTLETISRLKISSELF